MNRRSFLQSLAAMLGAAALGVSAPKPREQTIEPSPTPRIKTYEEMIREAHEAILRDIELAFIFGPSAFTA